MNSIIYILIFLFSLVSVCAEAQPPVRLELDASNMSLPFYTIPVNENGVVVLKAGEIKSRQLTGWELHHFDDDLKSVKKIKLSVDQKKIFSGWESNDSYVALLFLSQQTDADGSIEIYSLKEKRLLSVQISAPFKKIEDLVLILKEEKFYLLGLTETDRGRFSLRSRKNSSKNLLIMEGNCTNDSVKYHVQEIYGITEIVRTKLDPNSEALLLVAKVSTEKHKEKVDVIKITKECTIVSEPLFSFSFDDNKYVIDLLTGGFDDSLYAIGIYGHRAKSSRKNNSIVQAEGVFWAGNSSSNMAKPLCYPFAMFKSESQIMMRRYFEANLNRRQRNGNKQSFSFRMLLHGELYNHKGSEILVVEAYSPEYEYDNRNYYATYPSFYYGYYHPGYYNAGGRWVFKGFRYEYALLASFGSNGELKQESIIGLSDILDKNFHTRLSVLPHDEGVLLMYPSDGKIWYRFERDDNLVTEKESIVIELTSGLERIKENISMRVAPWYGNYFLVWGRQVVTNSDGKSRTVYYCNKLAFE